jgi:GNAT superfamily N-acetyltransferase
VHAWREQRRVGIDYLETATALLQRVRSAHPTNGLYEAADLHWWWRNPRSTDQLPQLFWFDDRGRPAAAVIATDWGDGSSAVYESTTLAPIVLPDTGPDWIAHVIERGLAHASECGIGTVELEVDRTDHVMRDVLFGHGFVIKEEGVVEAWLAADARPEISPLQEGYRLASRSDTTQRPHHMIGRSGPDVEQRLLQTSLYRPDLDLFIIDGDDNQVAYGLMWYDPETATGLVEPMRTQDDHQRRGLARHIIASGVDRLASAGAERIKICFEPGNPGASGLYLSVGFEPVKRTDVFSGRAGEKGS